MICDYTSLPLPDQIKANQAIVCSTLGSEPDWVVRVAKGCHGAQTIIGKAARLDLARREALS